MPDVSISNDARSGQEFALFSEVEGTPQLVLKTLEQSHSYNECVNLLMYLDPGGIGHSK